MTIDWQPAWSSEVTIESGGRFPLGTNRFHDALEDVLIKSITVLANRLRYFTYCCWVVGDIKTNEDCKEYDTFVEPFRRRENALAIGLYLANPDNSAYGRNTLAKRIKADEPKQNCSFQLMESVRIGAFELYYAGTLYNFGLTTTSPTGVTLLTDSGQELYGIAERYHQQKKTRYYRQYKGKQSVPTDVLKEWGISNAFDNIKEPESLAERDFFKYVLFHLETKERVFRRDTLALFLEAISVCNQNKTVFDEDKLLSIHYYSSFINAQNKIIPFSVPDHLKDVHYYWQIYEGHVFFRWWLDSYFQTFIRYLKSCDEKGSTIEEFFSAINAKEFNQAIKHFTGKSGDFYHGSMKDILAMFPQACKLEDKHSEYAIRCDEKKNTMSSRVAKFTLTMAGLYIKFKKQRSDRRYQFIVQKQQGNLWFEVLYHKSIEKMSVVEFLTKMLNTYCIHQHDQIMLEKRDLRKCWFTTINKKYYFNADVSLLWRPAKFNTIMNFLNDMNLIDRGEGYCRLTQEGQSFYTMLKAEYYK